MTNQRIGLAMAVLLAITACASKSPAKRAANDAYAKAPVAESGVQIPRFQIRDWSAPNDHTIIVVANNGTRYRAETLGPCLGLNFATQLAFVNRGGFEQVDRFSSVVLGDGTRCTFQSFDKLKAPEAQALDNYEKANDRDERKGENP